MKKLLTTLVLALTISAASAVTKVDINVCKTGITPTQLSILNSYKAKGYKALDLKGCKQNYYIITLIKY